MLASDGLSERARKERLAAAIAEKKKREERAFYEGNLYEFVRAAWSSIESSKFQDSWALEALCEHLQAVTRGDIKRLLINFPPRCGKSNITTICWPAWVWAQSTESFVSGPGVQFLCASYNHSLSLKHSNSSRRLLTSPFFQHYWGDRFKFMADQNSKSQYDTDKGGTRITTSVGGSLIGIGGAVLLCFPYEEIIWTDKGPMKIGDVVERKLNCKAWSYNRSSGRFELRRIVGWHRNPGRPLVKVLTEDGEGITCTEDHRILTAQGYVEASRLVPGDRLFAAPRGVHVASPLVGVSQVQTQMPPCAPVANLSNSAAAYAELLSQELSRIIMATGDLPHKFFSEMAGTIAKCAVSLGIRNVFGPSAVLQVIQTAIARVSVLMADLMPRGRWSLKCPQHGLVDPYLNGLAVASGIEPGVSLGGWRFNGLGLEKADLSRGLHYASSKRPNAPEVGNLISFFEPNQRQPEFLSVVGVNAVHDVPQHTYCLTVEGNHNMCCGAVSRIIAANCDDPHNTESVESEAERETVLHWWKELSTTRLNDPKESAIVVVMQRLHEKDVSGVILEGAREWTHLMLPMRYVPNRHCVTTLCKNPLVQWEDPRIHTQEPLLWPERYGEPEVKALETELGPYMASGRLQQRPTPAGGGIFKDDWWQPYILPLGKNFSHPFEVKVASLDPAFTAKEENDPSGFTVWGAYVDHNRRSKILLMQAWNKWLELHGEQVEELPGESFSAWVHRAKPSWGLVEWVAHECKRQNVDVLLIEDKASGHSVAQEIRRLYGNEKWQVILVNPGSQDKRARAYTVQHLFADGMIEAPASIVNEEDGSYEFRDWAQTMITEASLFRGLPGDDDNLIDSMTQGLKYLRDRGHAVRKDEGAAFENAMMRKNATSQKRKPLYDV